MKPLLKSTAWLLHALILPVSVKKRTKQSAWIKYRPAISFKKLGLCLLSWNVIFPASLMLFPRAEKQLPKEGIPASIVTELAPGKKIHVVHDNFIGNAAILLATGYFHTWRPQMQKLLFNKKIAAFARFKPRMMPAGSCVIYLRSPERVRDEQEDVKASVQRVSKGRWTYRPLLSPRETYLHTVLHEVTHCSDENMKLPKGMHKEGDADLQGILALEKIEQNSTLLRNFMVSSAFMGKDRDHDTVLYMHRALNDKQMPPIEELYRANNEAEAVVFNLSMRRRVEWDGLCAPLPTRHPLCTYNSKQEKLSRLAAERVRLHEEYKKQTLVRLTPMY